MRSGICVGTLVLLIVSGCGDQQAKVGSAEKNTATNLEPSNPAMTAANRILTALRNHDAEAMKSLFNQKNRENASDELLAEFFQQANQMIGDATQATELRAGVGPNEVLARIRAMGNEVCVLVLTAENGQYLLEDINIPSVEDYQSRPLVKATD